MQTAELMVQCRQQLAHAEACMARGIDERAAYEIAALAGLTQRLRWAAEAEYEAWIDTINQRGVSRRRQMAEAA